MTTEIVKSEEQGVLYQELDRRDELQIIQEMEGIILKEYTYTVQGQTKLSWAGIKECIRRMGRVTIDEPRFTSWTASITSW